MMTDSWWTKLSPGVKAALTVALVIILLEVLSDLLPGAGYLAALPFAIVIYYVQGLLVGRYLKDDPRYPHAGLGAYLGAGAVSAFWTAAVLSSVVTLIDTLLLTAVTLGGVLAGLPLVLAASLVDIALNFIFTLLGAWLSSRLSGQRLFGVSCALLGVVLVGLCLAGAVLGGALIAGGVDLIRGLPGIRATPTP